MYYESSKFASISFVVGGGGGTCSLIAQDFLLKANHFIEEMLIYEIAAVPRVHFQDRYQYLLSTTKPLSYCTMHYALGPPLLPLLSP